MKQKKEYCTCNQDEGYSINVKTNIVVCHSCGRIII